MNLLETTFKELTQYFTAQYGKGAYHARALLREVIKSGHIDIENISEFSASEKLLLAMKNDGLMETLLPIPNVVEQLEDEGTLKFLTRLRDDQHIESVIIPMKQYNTLCVSTQVGCRMGCLFCRTAQSGFVRNLFPGEISAQLFAARFILKKEISNIVFMGMGEPFDNMNAVMRAIEVFNEPHGFDIALRHMTLSTCGLIPGIQQLKSLNRPQLNLAVSINAADDRLRSYLMPINRKYPLAQLKKELLSYPLTSRRFILIEYILFKGVNDSKEDARKIADFLQGLKVRINLIGYNPSPNSTQGDDQITESHLIAMKRNKSPKQIKLRPVADKDIHKFASYLEGFGLFVVKRWGKGRAVQAGCGQLSADRY